MDVISRAAWGAKKPNSRQLLPTISLKGMGLHYSAAMADQVDDPNDCPSRVRGIQQYHMGTKRWLDIAYSFLVCHHGTIYEGRGWDIRTAANGTNPANDYWMAVCFLGADRDGRDDVTEPGRRAIRAVCDECERRYRGANQHRPHSHFKPTLCPGDEIRGWLARGMPLEQEEPVPDPVFTTPVLTPGLDHRPTCVVVRPQGDGYWIVSYDGGVFNFGKAPSGELVAIGGGPVERIIDAKAWPDGEGLLALGEDGGIFALAVRPGVGAVYYGRVMWRPT